MNWRHAIKRILAFAVLTVFMCVLFSVGSAFLGPRTGDALSPQEQNFAGLALVLVCLMDTLLFGIFILHARITGWRLMSITALIYYGVKSFQASIEAVYFMPNITADLAPGLFMMTLPVALLWPPLAVWLLGKAHAPVGREPRPSPLPPMSPATWAWKLALLGVVVYPLLFWSFGYFVAWQNPAVRDFYGGTEPVGFLRHMQNTFAADPFVLIFEMLRGLLWAAMAALYLWTMEDRPWPAALLLALTFALVENNTHLFPNPLMPAAVRQVHFVETASSNFLFGLIAAGLLLWQPAAQRRGGAESARPV